MLHFKDLIISLYNPFNSFPEILAGDSVELVCRSDRGHPVPDLNWAYQLDGQAVIQVDIRGHIRERYKVPDDTNKT